jgi:DNA-binding transcriptional regulator of glucitol operon
MIAVTCLVSLALCCGLAWWQWDRFMSASGTFQNLGYVLQWPLFGLFPAFMFWRIKKLREREQAEAADPAVPRAAPAEVTVPAPRRALVRQPAIVTEEDAELAAYNSYLRELHARDQQS